MEAAQRRVFETELEQRFAKTGETVFMLGLEHQCFLERAPRPRILLAREPRVPHPNVELYRTRIERESFAKYSERFVVLSLVVQLVRALVVLLRTQEGGGHGLTPPAREVMPIVPRCHG